MDSQILSTLKGIEDSLERLSSIENLLERVVKSNEEMAELLRKSWEATYQPPQR